MKPSFHRGKFSIGGRSDGLLHTTASEISGKAEGPAPVVSIVNAELSKAVIKPDCLNTWRQLPSINSPVLWIMCVCSIYLLCLLSPGCKGTYFTYLPRLWLSKSYKCRQFCLSFHNALITWVSECGKTRSWSSYLLVQKNGAKDTISLLNISPLSIASRFWLVPSPLLSKSNPFL